MISESTFYLEKEKKLEELEAEITAVRLTIDSVEEDLDVLYDYLDAVQVNSELEINVTDSSEELDDVGDLERQQEQLYKELDELGQHIQIIEELSFEDAKNHINAVLNLHKLGL